MADKAASMISIAFRLTFVVAACFSGLLHTVWIGPVGAQAVKETSKEIIAVQIRRQGYACDKPVSAERDKDASKPDEPVWILTCENFKYRVRLVPDMAAEVQRLN
jgi:hypothetical protein